MLVYIELLLGQGHQVVRRRAQLLYLLKNETNRLGLQQIIDHEARIIMYVIIIIKRTIRPILR